MILSVCYNLVIFSESFFISLTALVEMGRLSRAYCELAYRTEPVLGDVVLALADMGIKYDNLQVSIILIWILIDFNLFCSYVKTQSVELEKSRTQIFKVGTTGTLISARQSTIFIFIQFF